MTEHGFDYDRFEALTFDCYGTLIDWETGILRGLRATLDRHGVDAPDDELLELYSTAEERAESGPYLRYREILGRCLREACGHYGLAAEDDAAAAFGGSVADWAPFPDSSAALQRLRTRFRLGVITNCDDDLFAASNRRLDVEFDWIITAQSVGSYKPNRRNFETAFATLGLPRRRILHVAQSLFHDHVPAKELHLASVWIYRRHDRPGFGASPPATVTPDAIFPDMASFAAAATASGTARD